MKEKEQLDSIIKNLLKEQGKLEQKVNQEMLRAVIKKDLTRQQQLQGFLKRIKCLQVQRIMGGYEIRLTGDNQGTTKYEGNTLNLIYICVLLHEYQEEIKRDYQEFFKQEDWELLFDFNFHRKVETKQIVTILQEAKRIQKSMMNSPIRDSDWEKTVTELEVKEVNMKFEMAFPGYERVSIDLQEKESDLIPICQRLAAWIAAIRREVSNRQDCYTSRRRSMEGQLKDGIEKALLDFDD